MKLTTTGKSLVEEASYGTYVWQCADGTFLVDDELRHLSIFAMKGDREKMKALADAARHYGFAEGQPVFWAGNRKVTDDEFEEQVMRERLGLVPDPLDYGAIQDEMRAHRNG